MYWKPVKVTITSNNRWSKVALYRIMCKICPVLLSKRSIYDIFYFAIFQGCCEEVFFCMFRCITDIYSSKKIKFISVIQTYRTVCVYCKSNTSLYNKMVKLQISLWNVPSVGRNVPSVGKQVSVPDIRHLEGFITQGGQLIMWLCFFCFII